MKRRGLLSSLVGSTTYFVFTEAPFGIGWPQDSANHPCRRTRGQLICAILLEPMQVVKQHYSKGGGITSS